MTTMLERSKEMVGKQVRGRYTQAYKTEAVRQAQASQSLAAYFALDVLQSTPGSKK